MSTTQHWFFCTERGIAPICGSTSPVRARTMEDVNCRRCRHKMTVQPPYKWAGLKLDYWPVDTHISSHAKRRA